MEQLTQGRLSPSASRRHFGFGNHFLSLPDTWFQLAETQFDSAVSQPGQRSAKLDSPRAGVLTHRALTPLRATPFLLPPPDQSRSALPTRTGGRSLQGTHAFPLGQMLKLDLDFRAAAFAVTTNSYSLPNTQSCIPVIKAHLRSFCQCKWVSLPRKPGHRMKRKGAGHACISPT